MRPSEVLHQTPKGTGDGFPTRLPFLVLKAFPPVPPVPDLPTASHLFGPGGPGSAGHVFALPLQMHFAPTLEIERGSPQRSSRRGCRRR